MICTVYYKGTLREDKTLNDVSTLVSDHMRVVNATLVQSDTSVFVNFQNYCIETLDLSFDNKNFEGLWKWNGNNTEEFYRVLDMFIELEKLCRSLKIDDDEGIWNMYCAQKKPCRIQLRSLNSIEMVLLKRINANKNVRPNEVESFITAKTTLRPFNMSLLRAIVQDFISIVGITTISDFDPDIITDRTNDLAFYGKNGYREDVSFFNFHFSRMLLIIWISHYFSYKDFGIVKDIQADTRGLRSSKAAATEGNLSIFFNRHTGGPTNSKEAEMRKFAAMHYRTGALGEVMVIDEPKRELEFFFSMMDYLGFNYILPT